MTDDIEYSDTNSQDFDAFLEYLFETQIQPRLPLVRNRHRHHFEDEFELALGQLRWTNRVLTFIEQSGGDPYSTFKDEALANTIADASYGVRFHNRIAEESGLFDVLDDHYSEIAAGIEPRHLPPQEADTLRALGFSEVADHLPAILHMIRNRASRPREGRISQTLGGLPERLEAAQQQHRDSQKESRPSDLPRKSRRWFKGLGQVVQGSAMSIADIALAAGTLHLPVSPETRSWGTIASTTAGVGMILGGVGDIKGE